MLIAGTRTRAKRLIGLNRRKAEEWCEYHVVLFKSFCRRVIAPGPVSHTALMMIMHCVMDWIVRGQGRRAKAVISAMHTITGNNNKGYNILQRPWFMWWYMGQVYR
jgi:hypothetical protein